MNDPVVDFVYNTYKDYYSQKGYDKVKLKDDLYGNKDKYEGALKDFYEKSYKVHPEYDDLTFDTFRVIHYEKYGDPFKKKEESVEPSVESPQPSESPTDTLGTGVDLMAAMANIEGVSSSDAQRYQQEIKAFQYEKPSDLKDASALALVRERRAGDYESPGDQIAFAKQIPDEYVSKQLSRRTPFERLLYSFQGKPKGQKTLAQYEYDLKTLSTDMTQLNDAVAQIDKDLEQKYGETYLKDFEAKAQELERVVQKINGTENKEEYREEYERLSKEVGEFQDVLSERNQMVEAYTKSFNRAKDLLKQEDYKVVSELLGVYDDAQQFSDAIERLPGALGNIKSGKFASDIILKGVAKIPAAIGALEKAKQGLISGDKEYDFNNVVADYLIDFQKDIENLAPTPQKYTRPLFTKTAKVGEYEVDFEGDTPVVRKGGMPVDVTLSEEEIAKAKEQARTKFNPAGFAYQFGQLGTDVAVQLLATRGIAGGLTRMGMGANTASQVGVTMTTMGTMMPSLYEEGMEMFGDRAKASKYASISGLLVGLSSNLFGLENRLVGGKGFLDDILKTKSGFKADVRSALGQKSVADIARQRAGTMLKSALGETIEETVLETLLTNSTAYILGGDPGQVDAKEQAATGVLSFATGLVFGGFGQAEVSKSGKLALAENPDKFEQVLRQQIEVGNIKLPPKVFADESTAVDQFVQQQKIRFQTIGNQLAALDLKDQSKADQVVDLLDQKYDAELKAEKAKVMKMKSVEDIEKQRAQMIEEQILSYTNYAKEEVVEATEETKLADEVVEQATSGPENIKKPDSEAIEPVNPVVAMTVALQELTTGLTGELTLEEFQQEIGRRGNFAMELPGTGYIARGEQTDEGVTVSVENIDTGEVTKLSGQVLMDTAMQVSDIQRTKGEARMRMAELAKKINVETVDDAIAEGFASGMRVSEEDVKRYGDPNWIKDNPAIRTRYTEPGGDPIDQWAAQLSDQFGVDEQDVIQRIVEMIGNDAAGKYLRQRVMEQRRGDALQPLTEEEVLEVPEGENEFVSNLSDQIYAEWTPDEIEEFEAIVQANTTEDGIDWDGIADTIEKSDFLGLSNKVYEKLNDLGASDRQNEEPEAEDYWNKREREHQESRKNVSGLRIRVSEKRNRLIEQGRDTDAELEALEKELKQVQRFEKAARESMLNKDQQLGEGGQGVGIAAPGFMSFKIIPGWTVEKIKRHIVKFLKETFTSKGLLPQEVFDLNVNRMSYIASMMKRAEYARIDLQKALKEVYGKSIPSEEIMKELNNALRDPNLMYDGIVLMSDGTRLPQELIPALRNMRNIVKSLSSEMVATGVVDGDLAITFIENMDTYLHRAYRVHSDPDWMDKAKTLPLWGRARGWMRTQMSDEIQGWSDKLAEYEQKYENATNSMLRSQPGMDAYEKGKGARRHWQKKIDEANQKIETLNEKYFDTTQVDNELERLLEEQKDAFSYGSVSKKGKLGSKDLGILKQRKDLPKELRELYGEYDDAISAFIQTVYKQAHLAANARFLRDVETAGYGKFLFNEDDMRPAGFNTKIAGSKTMAPLDGYYTSAEIAEAFATFNEPVNIGGWAYPLVWTAGIAKYSKTILSPVTHVRNFVSNMFLHVINGRFGVEGSVEAMQMAKNDVEALSLRSAEAKEEYARLVELGVLDEGINFGEVKALLGDLEAQMEDTYNPVKDKANLFLRRWKSFRKFSEEMYKNEDNAHRIFAYNFEKNRYAKQKYKKSFDKLTDEEKAWVEDKAVKIVRATMPTYSIISKNVQMLRRIPFIGTFPSFPYESIRTLKNTLMLIDEEFKDKDLRPIAIQRGLGVSLSTAGVLALQKYMFAAIFGDEEDEDKIRWFLPPWSESSVIIPIYKDGTDFTYVDVQSVMPQGYALSMVNALFDRRSDNTVPNVMWAVLRPFLESDMTYQAMSQVLSGRDEKGNLISAPDDPLSYWNRFEPIREAMAPGFLTTGERLTKSITDPELAYYGRLYPSTEFTTLLTGVRFSPGNIEGSFNFRARDYSARAREDKGIYNREAKKQKYGKMSPGERKQKLAPYRERALEAWQKMQAEAIEMTADARSMGASPDALLQMLKDAGFNVREAEAIMAGVIIEPTFSQER